MRCPNCGSEVDEGALTCPHCQIDLSLTQRIPVTQAHWCPHCGALVAAAAESCPKCGLPLPQAVPAARPARAIRPTRNISLPEIDTAPAPGEKHDPLADADPHTSSSAAAADPTVLQQMPA
ncbi:MAG: zinc ribbon domain-containing protein, partial [Lancefieldella parvula]|nr:zinc ribbon domain-containing protein [Lancefieldella parvula]